MNSQALTIEKIPNIINKPEEMDLISPTSEEVDKKKYSFDKKETIENVSNSIENEKIIKSKILLNEDEINIKKYISNDNLDLPHDIMVNKLNQKPEKLKKITS